jgi:hypothetical protein
MTGNTGTVQVHLIVPVDDADALIRAGRRSIARDHQPWQFGQPSPAAEDPDGIIDSPAQAIVDLLMEAFVRCYGYNGATPLVDPVGGIADLQWGDRTWTPDQEADGQPTAAADRCVP